VIRPALFSTSRQQRAVGRNLALDTVASIGVGVTAALVTTLLPTIARRGGLEPIGLAALAAAPFIANLLGAFAGQIGPRSRNQLALIRASGAASLLLLAAFASAPVMIVVSIVFWLSLSLSGPSTCACGGRCTRHGSSVGSWASSAPGGRRRPLSQL